MRELGLKVQAETDNEFGSMGSFNGVPKGVRTPVAAVKGQCPRPLDDGDLELFSIGPWWS